MAIESLKYTNLQLVELVDSWPHFTHDVDAYRTHMQNYYYFMITGYQRPFGYVHKSSVQQMPWPDYWTIDKQHRLLTLKSSEGFKERSCLMQDTLRQGIESGSVQELTRWANELFPLYAADGEHVLDLDGAGVDMFGGANYSVHMIGWTIAADGSKNYWVPRRSMTKMSFPGMLDNTVGGSLPSGENPIDGIVRECEEELCLDPAYVRTNIKACGTASYHMSRTDLGYPGCQFQTQYLYEIELAEDVVPMIGDGEVGEIYLKSLDEVRAALANGEFKLNCAMTWIAYLIRHGHLTAENEPNLTEICSRLHRKHELFIA